MSCACATGVRIIFWDPNGLAERHLQDGRVEIEARDIYGTIQRLYLPQKHWEKLWAGKAIGYGDYTREYFLLREGIPDLNTGQRKQEYKLRANAVLEQFFGPGTKITVSTGEVLDKTAGVTAAGATAFVSVWAYGPQLLVVGHSFGNAISNTGRLVWQMGKNPRLGFEYLKYKAALAGAGVVESAATGFEIVTGEEVGLTPNDLASPATRTAKTIRSNSKSTLGVNEFIDDFSSQIDINSLNNRAGLERISLIWDNQLPDSKRAQIWNGSSNISFAEYNVNGVSGSLKSFAGRQTVKGYVDPIRKDDVIFGHRVIGHSRLTDSEAKILEQLASQFSLGSKGELLIYTERLSCGSCLNVTEEFRLLFPEISVIVIDGQGKAPIFRGGKRN